MNRQTSGAPEETPFQVDFDKVERISKARGIAEGRLRELVQKYTEALHRIVAGEVIEQGDAGR